MPSKTECPVTRAEFKQNARDLPITINGVQLNAMVKEFSTKSFGWYLNGKITVPLENGERVAVQVGLNLTVVGSKEVPIESNGVHV